MDVRKFRGNKSLKPFYMVVVNLKPKHKLHFSFCQDLGDKIFAKFEKEEGKGFDS